MVGPSSPLFGLIYGVAGSICLFRGVRRYDNRLLGALGWVFLVVAALDSYVEVHAPVPIAAFAFAAPVMIVGFGVAYTFFCFRLMEQSGVVSRGHQFFLSYLPLVYAYLLGWALISPRMSRLENPPLALLAGVVLLCALHVPLFAGGKAQAVKLVGSSPQTHPAFTLSRQGFPAIVYALGIPPLVAFVMQFMIQSDWRLWCLNAALAVFLGALCFVARQRVSESPLPDSKSCST